MKLIKGLLFSGIPLLINNLIWTVVGSIDKFVILGFMDTERLGFYGIATMAHTMMVVIPQTMSNVFYIKLNKWYGAHKDGRGLVDASQKYTWLTAACTGFICLIAYHAVPIFVEKIMPSYKNGVVAAQIIILGLAVYSSTMLLGNMFTILRKNVSLLINSAALCVFNAVFSSALVLIFGTDVKYVAIGTVISYCLDSLLLMIRLHSVTGEPWHSFLYYSWLPVLCATVPCIVTGFIGVSDLLKMCISFGMYAVFFLLFFGDNIKKIIRK